MALSSSVTGWGEGFRRDDIRQQCEGRYGDGHPGSTPFHKKTRENVPREAWQEESGEKMFGIPPAIPHFGVHQTFLSPPP